MSNEARKITDEGAKEALRLDGFIVDVDSPEHSSGSLLEAYKLGYRDAQFDCSNSLAEVGRVEALLAQYETDDREHLNTFGQHHPYAGWAADHLREALTGEA